MEEKKEKYINGTDLSEENLDYVEKNDKSKDDVNNAVSALERAGATVERISIPMHADGPHIWGGIANEGAATQMMHGNAYGINWHGYYDTPLIDAYGNAWRARPDDLSETVKLVMLIGEYMKRKYNGRYYGKAQNLRHSLISAYDSEFSKFDVLVMPTLPMRATELPEADSSREKIVEVALNMLANTCVFDVTGHPAITVPCGEADGLPIGMMIVGKLYDDAKVLRVAAACEEQNFYDV